MKNTKLKQIINKLIKEVMSEDFPDIEAKNYPEALFNQMGMDDLDIIYDNLIDEYNEKEAISQLANLLYNNMKNQDDIIEAIEKSKLNEEIKIALIDEVNDIFEEKNDLNRFDESYNRMKKLAGINEDNTFSDNHTVSNEQYELMDKTVDKYALRDFLDAAETIMGDFEEAGFPARDAFYWFYTKLTANI